MTLTITTTPLTAPVMFRASELLLNEVGRLLHVRFDAENFEVAARRANPDLQILSVSATRGDGLGAVYAWLRARRNSSTAGSRRRDERRGGLPHC